MTLIHKNKKESQISGRGAVSERSKENNSLKPASLDTDILNVSCAWDTLGKKPFTVHVLEQTSTPFGIGDCKSHYKQCLYSSAR